MFRWSQPTPQLLLKNVSSLLTCRNSMKFEYPIEYHWIKSAALAPFFWGNRGCFTSPDKHPWKSSPCEIGHPQRRRACVCRWAVHRVHPCWHLQSAQADFASEGDTLGGEGMTYVSSAYVATAMFFNLWMLCCTINLQAFDTHTFLILFADQVWSFKLLETKGNLTYWPLWFETPPTVWSKKNLTSLTSYSVSTSWFSMNDHP